MRRDPRANANDRGYDATWRRLRRLKLAHNPLCEQCELAGQVTAAIMVHHITPITGPDDPGRLDWDNLRSLCDPCHDHAHAGTGKQLAGCNLAGLPTNPNHPWRR